MAVIVDIKTFAAIGVGVIGSGWVARALAHGLDVVAWDPAPGAEKQLRENVANAWPALQRVGLGRGRVARAIALRRYDRGLRPAGGFHSGKRA